MSVLPEKNRRLRIFLCQRSTFLSIFRLLQRYPKIGAWCKVHVHVVHKMYPTSMQSILQFTTGENTQKNTHEYLSKESALR